MNNNYITYYQLLGVEPSASTEEILIAYKEKAKEYHPDKNDGHITATKLFQYIQEAKEVLTDAKKRLEYDYMAGIKKKPRSTSDKIHIPMNEKSNNIGTLLAAGAIGLLVGIFIGGASNARK